MIEKKAYAKVNLSLDITGRREDGYHLVKMVMQSLDIADVLTFEKKKVSGGGNASKIETLLKDTRYEGGADTSADNKQSKSESSLGVLPMGEDNLVYRVAELMLKKYVWPKDPDAGVKITLEKNIPIAAGMAGGSSDAAATFKGINELFDLGIHDTELMQMAVTLGADIPYCIMGGTALSEGIGEKLTKLPDIPKVLFLVAKPNISVSTAEAYGGYDNMLESVSTDGLRDKTTGKMFRRPDVDEQVDAIYAGSINRIAAGMSNVLELVTASNHPEINILENIMKDAGALNAIMSGSGPTVFGIFEDEEKAEFAKSKLLETGIIEQLFITGPVF